MRDKNSKEDTKQRKKQTTECCEKQISLENWKPN